MAADTRWSGTLRYELIFGKIPVKIPKTLFLYPGFIYNQGNGIISFIPRAGDSWHGNNANWKGIKDYDLQVESNDPSISNFTDIFQDANIDYYYTNPEYSSREYTIKRPFESASAFWNIRDGLDPHALYYRFIQVNDEQPPSEAYDNLPEPNTPTPNNPIPTNPNNPTPTPNNPNNQNNITPQPNNPNVTPIPNSPQSDKQDENNLWLWGIAGLLFLFFGGSNKRKR